MSCFGALSVGEAGGGKQPEHFSQFSWTRNVLKDYSIHSKRVPVDRWACDGSSGARSRATTLDHPDALSGGPK